MFSHPTLSGIQKLVDDFTDLVFVPSFYFILVWASKTSLTFVKENLLRWIHDAENWHSERELSKHSIIAASTFQNITRAFFFLFQKVHLCVGSKTTLYAFQSDTPVWEMVSSGVQQQVDWTRSLEGCNHKLHSQLSSWADLLSANLLICKGKNCHLPLIIYYSFSLSVNPVLERLRKEELSVAKSRQADRDKRAYRRREERQWPPCQ